MISDELDKKIRMYQAKRIQKENSTYSYSKTVNELLKKAL
jgi:translation initiation factor 2B subunit (eIF-2B alpha/beta/delta family)